MRHDLSTLHLVAIERDSHLSEPPPGCHRPPTEVCLLRWNLEDRGIR